LHFINYNVKKSVKKNTSSFPQNQKNKKMPVIKHNETPVVIQHNSIGYTGLSSSASISYSASLEPSRILAPNQNNNFRINGPLAAKISLNIIASTGFNIRSLSNLILNTLTGDQSSNIQIGGSIFSGCYLNAASVEISPFAPVSVSAEFTSANMLINTGFQTGQNITAIVNPRTIGYGYTTIINSGSALSDQNYATVSYRVSCNRTPSFTLGQKLVQNMFLDGVEKELSIKATNIGNFIDYSGYGDVVSIECRSNAGFDIFSPPLSMSSNSRIVSQNLSMEEGGILAGDISLREVVL